MIDEVLSEASVDLQQVDYIALTHGPGSFTGIRIALSVVMGLAYAARLPVIAVSSLDVLAMNAELPSLVSGQCLVSCVDARMGEVYWSVYKVLSGQLRRIDDYAVSTYSDFNDAFKALLDSESNIIGVGSGWGLAQIDIDDAVHTNSACFPKAVKLLEYLACTKDLSSCAQEASEIEPLYLRNEVAWQKRNRIRTKDL